MVTGRPGPAERARQRVAEQTADRTSARSEARSSSRPGAAPKPFRIAGLPAVRALFEQDPDRVERLFFDERLRAETGDWCTLLARQRKVFRLVPAEELEKIAGSAMHGGVVAVASARPVLPLTLAHVERRAAGRRPLLLLDGIGNPHNLGAIVRTAAFFGLDELILSDHPGQALPSESAYRVAEGGFEHVTLYRASRFAETLEQISRHYHTVGTALGASKPLRMVLSQRPLDDSRPLALLLGNEELGLPQATLRACSEVATIPGSGRVQSLNVSATAAILVFLLTEAQ